MKRILLVLFAVSLSFAMTACNSNRNSREAEKLLEKVDCTHNFTIMQAGLSGIYRISCEETESGFVKSVLVVH